MDELLARIGYLELGVSALKYYVVSNDNHESLRIVDDLAHVLLDINEELENSKEEE